MKYECPSCEAEFEAAESLLLKLCPGCDGLVVPRPIGSA